MYVSPVTSSCLRLRHPEPASGSQTKGSFGGPYVDDVKGLGVSYLDPKESRSGVRLGSGLRDEVVWRIIRKRKDEG